MATGDQNDIQSRLRQLIPHGWFLNGLSPLRDALLLGLANILAFGYSVLAYVRLQTRISTATDGFLDLIAADFFGSNLTRAANQTDASFRSRILINIFRERVTRRAVISILTQLTGRAPIVFEPARPADTGAYGAAVAVSRAASATYYDSTGTLRVAPPNTPRYTYDPANLSAPSSLLIESATTNQVINSSAFGATGWVNASALVTPNASSAPDGTSTASMLAEAAATAGHYIGQTPIFTAGQPYTASAYAKAAVGLRYFQLVLTVSAFGVNIIGSFDLVAGATAVTGPGTVRAQYVGNGWWRCSLTATPTTTSAAGVQLRLSTGLNAFAPTYLGDGASGVYLWGAQVEASASATSYIATGATAASRDADVIVNNMPAGSGASGGYGVAGGYDSLLLPMQAFVTAYRPATSGISGAGPYGVVQTQITGATYMLGGMLIPQQSVGIGGPGGYGVGAIEYASISQVSGSLTDADIFSAIDSVRPVSSILWARISN